MTVELPRGQKVMRKQTARGNEATTYRGHHHEPSLVAAALAFPYSSLSSTGIATQGHPW